MMAELSRAPPSLQSVSAASRSQLGEKVLFMTRRLPGLINGSFNELLTLLLISALEHAR